MIGMDIGTHSIKIVEGSLHGRVPTISKIASFPLPFDLYLEGKIRDEDSFINVLKDIKKKFHLGTKKISASMSSKGSIVRKLSLPYTHPSELTESLPFEIEHYLPFELSEANIDYQVLKSNPKTNRTDIIFAGVAKSIVNQIKHCFEEAELNLKILELGVLSSSNFAESFLRTNKQTIGLLDCGASWTHFTVMDEDIPIYSRDLQIGGVYLTKEIAQKLKLNDFEAEVLKQSLNKDTPSEVLEIMNYMADNLANEIKRSVEFFQAQNAGSKIQKIYATGGCARIPGILKIISDVLAIPIDPINPLSNIKLKTKYPDDYISEMNPLIVNACGAALR